MDLIMEHNHIPNPGRRGINRFITLLLAGYQDWKKLQRDKRALSHLSDQTLRDIGLDDYASQRRDSLLWPKL